MPYLTETELSNYFQTIDKLTAERDNLVHLLKEGADLVNDYAAENAHLTAAHAMQGEELVTLPRHMVYSMEDKLKEQAEEIRTLKQALTKIRATTVTLGDSQSAWKAWRKCSEIAGEALK